MPNGLQSQAPGEMRPLDFFWFIPTHGDGAYLGSDRRQRPADFRHTAVGKRVRVEGIGWGYDVQTDLPTSRVVFEGGTILVRGVDFNKPAVRGKVVRVVGTLRLASMQHPASLELCVLLVAVGGPAHLDAGGPSATLPGPSRSSRGPPARGRVGPVAAGHGQAIPHHGSSPQKRNVAVTPAVVPAGGAPGVSGVSPSKSWVPPVMPNDATGTCSHGFFAFSTALYRAPISDATSRS